MRATIEKYVYLAVAAVAVFLISIGSYAVVQGNNARNDVKDGLTREHVTVSKDAPNEALRNKPVDSAATARAEADAIWMHTMKATGGKTYSELAKDDPARATAKDGAFLRTGLMLSVNSFGVTDLVIGIGWAWIALGVAVLVLGTPGAYFLVRNKE